MDVSTLPKEAQEYIRSLENNARSTDALLLDKQNLEVQYQQQLKKLEDDYRQLDINYNILDQRYDILDQRYKLLLFQKYGRKSELIHEDQLSLFIEDPEQPEGITKNDESTITVEAHSRKKRGRKPIDDSLPREIIEHDIPESEKVCACGCALKRIGEETSEKLNVIPEQMWVERHVRPKYACPSCEGTADEDSPTVKITPVEPAIIPKSIVTPGLLAFILVNKFVDHLPYYRQEGRFERIGVHISRQDMSNWQTKAIDVLDPLFVLMKKHMKTGHILNMDETTVQVMNEPGREDTQESYMWLGIGGPPGERVFWYEYQPTRGSVNIHSFLEGFSGYLQTDGYPSYDTALKDYPNIVHVGCFAHARRRFFEASKTAKNVSSAMEGIKWIRKLYDLEEPLRKKHSENINIFFLERKEKAKEILSGFKEWLDKKALHILPSGLLGDAISYTLAQWNKLIAYIELPELTPDNNISENAIRPFVLGRKNWLFSGSPHGAQTSCRVYTLIETAKHLGLDLHEYLRTVFEMAPLAKTEQDWVALLPWNFKKFMGAV